MPRSSPEHQWTAILSLLERTIAKFKTSFALALQMFSIELSGCSDLAKYSSAKRGLLLLLSHHPPGRLDRCLRLSVGTRGVYLCARCTGICAGLFLSYFAQGIMPTFAFLRGFFPFVGSLLVLPAYVDWSTQTIGFRESNNWLRVMTGFLSGCGIFLLLSIATSYQDLVLIAVNLYIVGILSVHLLRGRKTRREM